MIAVKKSRARSSDRKPENVAPVNEARTQTLSSPTRGWVEGAAVTDENGLLVGDNVFPTTRGVRLRGGAFRAAAIGTAVTSVFTYRSALSETFFAASATDVYDVSSLDPNTVPTADLTSRNGGIYSTAMMGTTAGEYLYVVNGADSAQIYDGSAWTEIDGASTPAITGVTTSDLKYVWKHKNRLWFIESGTKTAWYLPVDSIGGAAADFSLDGVFQLGGALLFGATWSADSGDGMDDRCVFVSDQGEVAVYAGTNPAVAADWGMVGLYRMPPPLGQDAHMKAGGDIVVATETGLMPLSEVISKDPAALELYAVSRNIRPSWISQSRSALAAKPWQVIKWPREQMIAIVMPTSQSEVFVANSETGAWCKYTGWDMQCAEIYNQQMMFGSEDGYIYQAERGGDDGGVAYTSRWAYSPQRLGVGGVTKVGNGLRATFAAGNEFSPQLSMSQDYVVDFPSPPNAANDPASTASTWDVGIWDTAIWDASLVEPANVPIVTTGWVAQGAVGDTLVPQFQVTVESTNRPNIEFLFADILYEVGTPVG